MIQCRGALLVWIIVGQGPAVLSGGMGGSCMDIFLASVISFSSSVLEMA